MNPSDPVRSQFDFIYRSIRANTGDMSDEEALITPEQGGNSINRIFGHILVSRNDIFSLLSRKPPFDSEKYKPYLRGSKGEPESWNVIPLSELRQDLDYSQKLLIDALKATSLREDVLNRIAHMCFHEAYHAGQIGMMRRVIGKEGAIR